MVRTIEYIVRGNLNHITITLLNRLGEITWSDIVEKVAQRHVFLSLIHRRVSSTVHDAVHLVLLNKPVNRLGIRNVEFLHISEEILMLGILLCEQLHLVAQLPIAACNQYVHTYFYI